MKTLRVAICLMLVVGVLAMSISVFADNEPIVTPSPYPGTEDNPLMTFNVDQIAFLVWQLLASWGIDITYDDIAQYTTPVQMQIVNWLWEFLDEQPSVESILAWALDWYFYTDMFGNLVVNQTLLDDVESFANWLENKYGLTDNSTINLNPTYAIDNLTLYELNHYYAAVRADTEEVGTFIKVSANGLNDAEVNGIYYFVAQIGNRLYFVFVSTRQLSSTAIQTAGMYANGEVSGRSTTVISFYTSNVNVNSVYQNKSMKVYAPYGPNGMNDATYIPQDAVVGVYANDTELQNFLNNCDIVIDSEGAIVTTSIVLPEDDPDYVTGDGMTIIDGSPYYGEVVIPDSVAVNNLPAIITQRNIPDIGNDVENPGFSVPWQAVNGLIQYVAAPAGAIMALVNEAPVEGVIMLYALIGGMIIFGMIRIMREH